ncbi:sulfatase/phosphatase domain-containing protein [Maribellus mangrovi]|uniref:sulfatase/phosphatase domain-containing protein n=1 Tax=Maribellus mangrovi TaxID=3133146 RepID=UPI0030ED48A4
MHGYKLKIAPYDANLLAPMIVRQPNRFAEGKVCNYPINGVDIIKTTHSLCNVTPSNKLDGCDFRQLLINPEQENWKDSVMIQLYIGNRYGNEVITEALKDACKTGN